MVKIKKGKRILKVLLCLLLLLPFELRGFGTQSALALDTTVVKYNDYYAPAADLYAELPPTSGFLDDAFKAKSYVHRDAFSVTNIQYNRVTKNFSFDITTFTSTIKTYRENHSPTWFIMADHAAHTKYSVYGFSPYVNKDHEFEMDGRHEGNSIDDRPIEYEESSYTAEGKSFSFDMNFVDYYGHYLSGDPKFLEVGTSWVDMLYNGQYVTYAVNDYHKIPLITNSAPSLSLTTQNNLTIQNEEGQNIFNVTGYAQDPDNDTLDVIVEIPNVYYRKIKVYNSYTSQQFTVPIDAINDSLQPGSYTGTVTVVDRFNLKASGQFNFNVKNKLKNKNYYLINSPFEIGSTYSDYESDPQYSVRFRYDQDSSFFDNPMGTIYDSGLWRGTMYTSFPYSGLYNAIVQVRDNPKNDRFDEFRLWSGNNQSSLVFLIHRKPTALFSARLIGNTIQLTDNSFDIDHTTASNKGLIEHQWQWRKVGDEVWTDGQLSSRPANDAYEIRLRVRDMDGAQGIGVYSDWASQVVGTGSNLPPVANFIIDPIHVSYRKSTTITDKSYDPDNDYLDTYEWIIRKNGGQVYYNNGSYVTPPSLTNYGVGSYEVILRVRDNRGVWSNYYSQWATVINNKPVAQFTMPAQVYRDDVVTMENTTPDPDADGDALSYTWYGRKGNSSYIYGGSNRNHNVAIRNLISGLGITDKAAISQDWEMRLNVSDGSQEAFATRVFEILNHVPTTDISGPAAATQYTTQTYTSGASDLDSADISSLQYYWRVIDSEGQATLLHNNKSVNVTFYNTGVYTIEHWAVDQIGAKSNIASLKVTVNENFAPAMTLTAPAGTAASPTIIDASITGDPLIKWTYVDPENDPQEQYRLEFYTKDSILAKTIENSDGTGAVRQYQIPNGTFEKFKLFTVLGRVYSMYSWSEVSNEKTFIIDNPPQPGFTLMTDTGRNAAQVPIYRTDRLTIQGTATDADTAKGDSISYKYYLKPFGGTEELASSQSAFTKQFSTNGIFTLRQVVTDSLGLSRELVQNINVANRIPTASITYPSSTSQSTPTVVSTLTPVIKWDYQDDDGDVQQRYRVRIMNLTTGAVTVQSGEQTSSAQQWQIPAGALVENQKYAVEAEVYDGFSWSSVTPRKYFMVNLLTVQGLVRHTAEWNVNRQTYNMGKSGTAESPRGYNIFWAGERFVLQANTAGLPDSVEVTMTGGYRAVLHSTDANKTQWMGELYDPVFEKLPDGPVTFTFTARNEWNTKTDTVTVSILGDWSEYFQSHRIK
ncbi:hypothetical protein [Paenibacillus tianjinensis]|uniref:PKD domain-containing protein n=1 Tax=Paenibacillus tianjinensis TaxID=2810347 RepID=A0ABX7LDA9_9BACL|nr:hypothetical protein [Paenibacillus tianjinensis]QSF46012.1 hypothetical protein JRJ22_05145 [Paenibacillus tianjinensis]